MTWLTFLLPPCHCSQMLIGVAIAIGANTVIPIGLNLQKYAHRQAERHAEGVCWRSSSSTSSTRSTRPAAAPAAELGGRGLLRVGDGGHAPAVASCAPAPACLSPLPETDEYALHYCVRACACVCVCVCVCVCSRRRPRQVYAKSRLVGRAGVHGLGRGLQPAGVRLLAHLPRRARRSDRSARQRSAAAAASVPPPTSLPTPLPTPLLSPLPPHTPSRRVLATPHPLPPLSFLLSAALCSLSLARARSQACSRPCACTRPLDSETPWGSSASRAAWCSW